MKRAVLCILALAASACAHSQEEMQAWCSRYAAKHMAHGTHEDLNAYREDLMSSCMAMRGYPYTKAPASDAVRRSSTR